MNNLRISPPPLSSCKNLPAYFFNGAYGVDAPPAVYCVVNNNKTKKKFYAKYGTIHVSGPLWNEMG